MLQFAKAREPSKDASHAQVLTPYHPLYQQQLPGLPRSVYSLNKAPRSHLGIPQSRPECSCPPAAVAAVAELDYVNEHQACECVSML